MTLEIVLILAMTGFFVGIAKTAVGGFGLLAVTLIVTVLPARESTGLMLLILLVGDLFAIKMFKNYVEWRILQSLSFPVIFGIILGSVFLFWTSDSFLKTVIGWVVIFMVMTFPLGQTWQRRVGELSQETFMILRIFLGSSAGFMSTIANAGGTPISIYLFLKKSSKYNYLGNSAWIFFMINLSKLPFILFINLISFSSLKYLIPALPMVAVGAFLGRKLVDKINQSLFQNLSLIFSAVVGLRLIFA